MRYRRWYRGSLPATGRRPTARRVPPARWPKLLNSTVLVTAHPKWKPEAGGIRPDAVIRLDVGPELIAGSTRLKAGTVTKMVCNILSSVAMIRLGRVYDNLMVHVVPSNEKLKARAIRLVRLLTGAEMEEAAAALGKSSNSVRRAVKLLGG